MTTWTPCLYPVAPLAGKLENQPLHGSQRSPDNSSNPGHPQTSLGAHVLGERISYLIMHLSPTVTRFQGPPRHRPPGLNAETWHTQTVFKK